MEQVFDPLRRFMSAGDPTYGASMVWLMYVFSVAI